MSTSKWMQTTIDKNGNQYTKRDLITAMWIGIFLPISIPFLIYMEIKDSYMLKKEEKERDKNEAIPRNQTKKEN